MLFLYLHFSPTATSTVGKRNLSPSQSRSWPGGPSIGGDFWHWAWSRQIPSRTLRGKEKETGKDEEGPFHRLGWLIMGLELSLHSALETLIEGKKLHQGFSLRAKNLCSTQKRDQMFLIIFILIWVNSHSPIPGGSEAWQGPPLLKMIRPFWQPSPPLFRGFVMCIKSPEYFKYNVSLHRALPTLVIFSRISLS